MVVEEAKEDARLYAAMVEVELQEAPAKEVNYLIPRRMAMTREVSIPVRRLMILTTLDPSVLLKILSWRIYATEKMNRKRNNWLMRRLRTSFQIRSIGKD